MDNFDSPEGVRSATAVVFEGFLDAGKGAVYDDSDVAQFGKKASEIGLSKDFPVDNNPKARLGALKAPLHLVPPSVKIALAEALADGAIKYGAYNWRDEDISVSTYVGGFTRHVDAYWDGEDFAEDSGIHHLHHALANIALMIDAMSVGKLIDDRPTKGAAAELQADYHAKQTARHVPDVELDR